MAERTLTGEIGNLHLPGAPRMATSDREHDCVPEIDDAQLPAALADSITFTIARGHDARRCFHPRDSPPAATMSCRRGRRRPSPEAATRRRSRCRADGTQLYVVNADADSVSIIDTPSRTLVAEISLGTPAHRRGGDFAPQVMPRALALSPTARRCTSPASAPARCTRSISRRTQFRVATVGSEPIGVAVGGRRRRLRRVLAGRRGRASSMPRRSAFSAPSRSTPNRGRSAGRRDGTLLFVSHLLGRRTVVDRSDEPVTVRATSTIPDTAPRGDDPRLAHGQVARPLRRRRAPGQPTSCGSRT